MADTHIASFVVQHRADATDRLDASIATSPELELAQRAGSRSIVLCESEDPRALMERIDDLQSVPGVLSVALVYHHVEASVQLDEAMDPHDGPRACKPTGEAA